ncbi:hypothetical protein BZG11_15550, partial [Salinivibrio kushneri]
FRDDIKHIHFKSKPTFYLRLMVELFIPLVFAAYSVVSLINTETPKKVPPKPVVQKHANKQINQDK